MEHFQISSNFPSVSNETKHGGIFDFFQGKTREESSQENDPFLSVEPSWHEELD